jgi:GDP-D-mannose dehydratase
VANPTRARERLGWEPLTTFRDMIYAMVDADIARLQRGES